MPTPSPDPIAVEITDALGQMVERNFIRARDARAQTDELLLACLRQRKGEYSTEELVECGDIKTFINATSTKCRAGEAWLDDILASIKDQRPWALRHTPIVDAPEYILTAVKARLKKEVLDYGVTPEQVDAYLRDRAEDLKELSIKFVNERATQATAGMTELIADQLTDAKFDDAFSQVRSDVITYPYSVLKGPVVRNAKKLTWDARSKVPIVITAPTLTVERVSPFDYYWSPGKVKPGEGYDIELMRMERKAIYDCIGLPNFKEDAIRDLLRQHPDGHMVDAPTRSAREALEQNTTFLLTGETIDVLDYWGAVEGLLLKEWGVPNIDDEEKYYEVNVWVSAGICIRAVLNPDPLGRRPFHITNYERIPGALVGKSVPMLMRPHQEMINSSYRALRRNLGLAAGPFAEVDGSRLASEAAPEVIKPAMVKVVTPDLTGGGQAAYRFHNINSHAAELIGVIDHQTRACDEATLIPAYSYGNAAAAGAGRTVGGLAMLMGNAAKGIKKVIANVQSYQLAPLIHQFYTYNMIYHPDASVKVDAQVIADGPSGVIMREANLQKQMETLQLSTPFMQAGVIKEEGILYLLRQIYIGLGVDADKIIPDPAIKSTIQDAADKYQAEQNGQQPSQNGQQPPQNPNVVQISGRGNPTLPASRAFEQAGVPQPQGRGVGQFQAGKVGVGTTPTAVIDGRSGATAQALASSSQV